MLIKISALFISKCILRYKEFQLQRINNSFALKNEWIMIYGLSLLRLPTYLLSGCFIV